MIALIKGLLLTLSHVFKRRFTVQYPEERKEIPPRARWKLALQRNEDGSERCIACMLCAAACPSECIYIEGADVDDEHPVGRGERYAEVWDWDMGRCIFCGFCVEACPDEALVMTDDYELAVRSRNAMLLHKEALLSDGPPRFAWLGNYRRNTDAHEPLARAAEVHAAETDYFATRGAGIERGFGERSRREQLTAEPQEPSTDAADRDEEEK